MAIITGTLYSAENSLTVTNLQSLASSATAGWGSATQDNATTDQYDDVEITVTLDPANTVPANSKAFFVFIFHGTSATALNTTGAATGGAPGTEGALTFPDVSANPTNLRLAGRIQYLNADVPQAITFSLLEVLGFMPAFWGVAIVNHSGAALAATGNSVKWRGLKYTSA